MVENGVEIRAGDAITDGPINPQEFLETRARTLSSAIWSRNPEGLPQPGRHDQRQAH